MSFETTWLMENHIIHHRIWGHFTRDEVSEADELLKQMLDSGTGEKIHLLINDGEIEEMPPITSLRALTVASHPKLGWSLIYGNKNKGLRFTTNIATKILGIRFMMAESYEHALEKLYLIDANLPPMK